MATTSLTHMRPEALPLATGTGARRIVSVHLPRLAIERWTTIRERSGNPVPDDFAAVLATEGRHGPVVHAATRTAEARGVRVGSRVVDMKALCPGLAVDYADVAGDRMALQNLMVWARRWCPWTSVEGPSGLMLDTTGSDHLWGGEAAMLAEIEGRLALLGLSAELAVAPTQGAAWALARHGAVRAVCRPEKLALMLSPLPIRALRIDGNTRLTLNRLGLTTIGALADVPRASIARRFPEGVPAANPLMRLDQALGHLPEPLSPPEDPPRFVAETRLAEPVETIAPHLPALCETLVTALEAEGFGARVLELTVYRTDGEVRRAEAVTALPSRDPAHLARLISEKIDRINPGFGFDLITLSAPVAEDMTLVQTRLDGESDTATELARLIDRLSARLGPTRVTRLTPKGSHIPERAETPVPALDGAAETLTPRRRVGANPPLPEIPSPPRRPIRLFDPPEEVRVLYAVPDGPPAQFTWRRLTCRVTRFAGPERIAPEWWQDRPGTRLRDYYRIEDASGRRLWLYREGLAEDGRGEAPRWFVHGVFA